MPFRSWLATCSTATCTAVEEGSTQKRKPPPKIIPSSFSSSENLSTSLSSSETTTSLPTNLSIQTLPSVPSLQNSPPHSSNSTTLTISHLLVSSLKPSSSHITTSLALSPTKNLLYSASSSQIQIFNLPNLTQLESFTNPHSGSIKSLAFSDGKIFTAHQDSKIRVWEINASNRHRLLTSLPTVNDRLLRFAFPKNYVRIRRHKKCLWIQHADAVTSIAVSNGLLYSVSWDKSLKIWRTSDLRCVESLNNAHEDAVNAVAVNFDGTVFTGSADCKIRVWARGIEGGEKNKKHSLIATLERHKSAVNALALNHDGSILFSGACDRSILVWEREDSANYMTVTGALRGHGGAILCLINVSDFLFSGSADRTVRIWKQDGENNNRYCCLGVLEGHLKAVKSLVAVWDEGFGGFSVCSGSLDGEMKVWKVEVSNIKGSCCSSSLNLLGWKL
ncbi:transducin/WD40 repeat-like superfamily protein [Tasmannia lanceolata]|uniref:transducin/WD40 repeat-like superfamily protein n=1 Tax=Tasmannia lanceolata TaxID=3420 RepID=UPI004063EA96